MPALSFIALLKTRPQQVPALLRAHDGVRESGVMACFGSSLRQLDAGKEREQNRLLQNARGI